jgi:hypothetical protein
MKLPAEGRQGEAPEWPLRPDVQLSARLEVLRAEQADLEAALDGCEPGKEANRLRHRLGQNVEKVALTEAVIRNADELERELWADLWATPQAVAWERLRWTREVAQYARWKARAELGDLDASKEARMLGDRLGLTPMSLQSLHWEIVADEVAEKRQRSGGARGRIKAV